MTTEEKMNLLIEMISDIYTVAEKLGAHVGIELIPPAALKKFLAKQKEDEVGGRV